LERLGILNLLPPQNLMMDRLEALKQAVALVNRLGKGAAANEYPLEVNPTASQGYRTDVDDAAMPQ
jgi:SulP family sulfate permease